MQTVVGDNVPFADSSLRRTSAFDPLRDAIESLVDGTLQPSTTSDLCESFLHEHALRSELVTAARDLCSMLEQAGCTTYLQYCTSSEFRHPVPVIIALDSAGNFVLPNVNCVWNPTIPEERDAKGSDSHKKHVIAPEELEDAEGVKKVVLRLERFPETAPVCVALLPTSSPAAPADAYPIFSTQAFSEALKHAATSIISNDPSGFFFIRDEVLVPELRNRIRETSALFGAQEIPEMHDIGTAADGTTFAIETFIPQPDITKPMRAHLSVRSDTRGFYCINANAL